MQRSIKSIGALIFIFSFIFALAQPASAAPKTTPTNPRNPHSTPPVNPPPTGTNIWGAYTGNNDQTMADFETYVGKSMNVNAIFWGWDSPFPQTVTGSQGKTLLVFWEPSFSFDQINNGSMDAYITQFALGAKAYGYPVILSPFDEFNLNEAPWGQNVGTNTPPKFIAAWQRVRTIFTANSVSNVKFALTYNNVSIPSASYATFYPGDAYVDYVGIDGFNFGGQTFAQVFNTAITEAKTFNKPVWIFSTGSIGPKSQFITDLGAAGYPWIWFNKSPFNIDAESLAAFKAII
jgi:mannan endo-1,4-beta-mannosidase